MKHGVAGLQVVHHGCNVLAAAGCSLWWPARVGAAITVGSTKLCGSACMSQLLLRQQQFVLLISSSTGWLTLGWCGVLLGLTASLAGLLGDLHNLYWATSIG